MPETNLPPLPPGWAATTLGEVADVPVVQNGPTGDFVYIDIGSIDNQAKRIVDPKQLTCVEAPSRARQRLQPYDVLVSMTRPNLNAVAIVPEQMTDAIGSTGFYVLRTKHIEPYLLWYLVQSSAFVKAMSDLVLGVLYPAVRPKDIAVFAFALPPRNEQQRIVAEIEKQFSRLEAGVAALKRVQANLKRYRAAVLRAACEGRLVPTEAELARQEGRAYEPANALLQRILRERRARWEAEQLAKLEAQGRLPLNDTWKAKYPEPAASDTSSLPELPEGWIWARAEQLCGFITKGTTPSENNLYSGSGEVPFIKVYNLTQRGRLDFSVNPTFISKTVHKAALGRSGVFPGDVLMNIVGPPLGKVSVVPDSYPEWNINQAIAIYRSLPGLNRHYLCQCLLTDSVLKWAIGRSKATAGQFNLTLEICRDLPVPLPPLDEQERIVAEVERRLSIVEEVEATVAANLKRAERLRQAVLGQAFAGRLVPQDPNDEPASALLERIQAERAANAVPRKDRANTRQGLQPALDMGAGD